MQELLLAAEIAGAILVFVSFFAFFRNCVKWAKRITAGTLCQLRSDMLRTYYRNKDAEKIRQYELENFMIEYEEYTALGGNSFVEEIHSKVKEWEVLP